MSGTPEAANDPAEAVAEADPSAELAGLVGELRRHVEWMADAGIRTVKRSTEPAPVRPPAPAPAPTAPARAAPPVLVSPPPAARTAPPPAAAAAPPRAEADPAAELERIRTELGPCTRCRLCEHRRHVVFGQGFARTQLVFVGEGPGEEEDNTGLAFVGRAGQLLTKMISAMGFDRDKDVYICNIVKCRPPGNRRPEPDEIAACRPFVERQLKAIAPRAIVLLGATAAQALLRVDAPIGRLRNRWTSWEGIPAMPTFHPSYLLRAPQEKAKAWDDLKLVMERLGKALPQRSQ